MEPSGEVKADSSNYEDEGEEEEEKEGDLNEGLSTSREDANCKLAF